MAPESFTKTRLTAKVDVWSFGISLLEVLIGMCEVLLSLLIIHLAVLECKPGIEMI